MRPLRSIVAASVLFGACSLDESVSVAPPEMQSSARANQIAGSLWNAIDYGYDPNFASGTSGTAISDHGHIAGFSVDGLNSSPQTYIQRARGSRTYLPPLPGDAGSYPFGISDVGLVAGVSETSRLGPFHAVYWDPEGHVFPIPGVSNGQPTKVSNGGWIVGYDGGHAFRWRPGSTLLILQGDATHPGARAFGVNDGGIVVGEAGGPAKWSATGKLERLPMVPGALTGLAKDISNAGEIVGYFIMSDLSFRAFRWTEAQGMSLLQLPTGHTYSLARDVDSRGRIYGWAALDANSTGRPFVWVNGVPQRLPELLDLSAVVQVNNCGVGVGTGWDGARSHTLVWLTEC